MPILINCRPVLCRHLNGFFIDQHDKRPVEKSTSKDADLSLADTQSSALNSSDQQKVGVKRVTTVQGEGNSAVEELTLILIGSGLAGTGT